MHYGTIISGGAPMRKGVTKEINDKLEGLAENRARGAKIAKQVEEIYAVNTLSEQHTDGIHNPGKFKKPKQEKNV
jgi:hypothetical protein